MSSLPQKHPISVADYLSGELNSDMKIGVRQSHSVRFYYPDLSVVCQPNPDEALFQDQPVVIVEVLSDSTRRVDEFEKRIAYMTIMCTELLCTKQVSMDFLG